MLQIVITVFWLTSTHVGRDIVLPHEFKNFNDDCETAAEKLAKQLKAKQGYSFRVACKRFDKA